MACFHRAASQGGKQVLAVFRSTHFSDTTLGLAWPHQNAWQAQTIVQNSRAPLQGDASRGLSQRLHCFLEYAYDIVLVHFR